MTPSAPSAKLRPETDGPRLCQNRRRRTDPEDIRLVEAAWAEAREAILSGEWDLVVLDEINYAISYGMLDPEQVAETLRARPKWSTSSSPAATPTHIVDLADTVTEMREVKHAYQKGILAQRGIEY